MTVEGLLQWVQPIVARQPLDCDQRGPVGLHREHQAGSDGCPVAHDRARAADTVLASYMRSIPVNADIPSDIAVHFVEEVDEKASPIGGKGIGELVHRF